MHLHFKIPCDDLDETTTCNIKRGTMLCELIQASPLIIWDKALMTNRIAFEAIDNTLHDILSSHSSENSNIPFGGKVVVLGGDIRQTLPVIEGGSCSQIINSAIVNSSLWPHVTILHLKRNMRLSAPKLTNESRMELARFSGWMLGIGEGNIESRTKEGESKASWIQIPGEFLLKPMGDKVPCIIKDIKIYGS
jgi:ATP-dependent DNA helicase PIF1